MNVMERQQSQADVSQVVRALYSPRRFSCGLYAWQDKCDERRDDGDRHKKFYECKTV